MTNKLKGFIEELVKIAAPGISYGPHFKDATKAKVAYYQNPKSMKVAYYQNPSTMRKLAELKKLAITRPTVEWFPEDYPSGRSAMLHRTAEGNMFEDSIDYIPKKFKPSAKARVINDEEREKDRKKDEDISGSTRWAEEISDRSTAYHISPHPITYIRSK